MISCFTPRKVRRLNIGDVFFGESEFILGREVEDKIEVGVTEEQCIKEERIVEKIATKGKLFTVPRIRKTNISNIDESRKNATWVVVDTKHLDSIELIHSTLPASDLVTAKRLVDGELTETIEFYTSGIYENTISKEFEIIGKYN